MELEDKADSPPPELCQLVFAKLGNIPLFQQHLASRGLFQRTQDMQQGALTGAGGAHHGDKLAASHGKINPPQHFDLPAALAIGLAHLASFQDGCSVTILCHFCSPGCGSGMTSRSCEVTTVRSQPSK